MQVHIRARTRSLDRLALVSLLAFLLAFSLVERAQGGANAGGYLFLYTNDSIVYSSDLTSYAHRSGVECPEDQVGGCPPYQGMNCTEKVAQAVTGCSSQRTNDTVVFWLLAEWPMELCPRLRGVLFGLDYDAAGLQLEAWGSTADFEITSAGPGGDWPAPLSGTALTWNGAQTSHLKELYWFAGYVGDQPTTLTIAEHPIQGAPVFGDDAVPSASDPIGFDGVGGGPIFPLLGLAGAQGTQGLDLVDPDPTIVACCLADKSCIMLTPTLCSGQGGDISGEQCDPALCLTARGACCAIDRGCTYLSTDDCAMLGGEFLGADAPCLPVSCGANPTPGACCLDCPGGCVMLEQSQCVGVGGVFQGEGSSCESNPCPVLTGACCLPTEECVIATEDGCGAMLGGYDGDCALCDPSECVSRAVERETWGGVKYRYR